MGIATATHEFKSSHPAPRMFKAIVLDSPTIFPNFIPQYKCDILQGDGGAGSILQTCFPAEGGQVRIVKHRVEAKDPSSCYSKYTLIEGGALSDNVESMVNEMKVEAAGDGCVVKAINHYHHTKGEMDKTLIDIIGQQTLEMYKGVEDYLSANPTVCA